MALHFWFTYSVSRALPFIVALLLGHWYEIMSLYYVKSILTEISASREDKRVLQKSKVIRIKLFEHMGLADV